MSNRLERAREAMAGAGVDALVLTPGPDLKYLTALGDVHAGERLVALVLPREGAKEIDAALVARAPGYRPAFCIVASGPNGAMPHYDTGDRTLHEGDMVVMDYGGYLDGYVADITITAAVGEPADAEARKVYR